MVAEIAAFLFGNKISREDALELFDVFSNLSSQCKELGEKYDIWSTNEGRIHMATYYNMSIGLMLHINGSKHNQLELVDVDPDDIKIGF